MNRKAFSRINYGLFIVGAELDGMPQGCIVNSLHQVTSSMPFKFSLTVNKSNETFKAIEAKGSFAATVLAKDTPKDLVNLFGYKSGRVVNKFDGFDVERDGAGNPYVKDHALARFSWKVVEKLDLGTYMPYIAETTLYSAHRHCGPNPGGQRGLEMHHLRLCGGEGNSARRLSVPYLPGQQRQICKTVKG